jgi:choice-of-anchor B domain-containing protein
MKTKILMIVGLAAAAWLPEAKAEACVDGASAGFACSHIEFLGHLSPAEMDGAGEVLNDIWGWVDPSNNDEYAIIGMRNGTAFVRILDDGTPEFLGRLAASDDHSDMDKSLPGMRARKSCHDDACGSDSAWRDIKAHGHYAYIVSEAAGHGVQVFDLEALRVVDGDAPQDFTADDVQPYYGYYDGIGHAHNIFINEDTARAYVVGHDGNGRAGGLHILSLADPMNPQFIGEADIDGYTHDVQCVVYDGPDADIAPGSELCFASNEDTVTVWDVTDAGAPVMLSRTGYSDSGYTHQGWLSDDRHYFFVNDELDEVGDGTRTHLRVFDVRDVHAPVVAADYFAPTLAIDHNNYVHGRWLYQSNYAAGLRILDILDPLNPVEAAYFDPQPTDHVNFYGTWSNYLLPSGVTVFSDINAGLYVVRPTLLDDVATPDLAVALSLAASETDVNEMVEGSLTLSADAAVGSNDTLLTLHLPSGAVFGTIVEPAGWTCESGDGGRVQECRVGLLDAGAEAAFDFTVQSSVGGAVRVIAMAYANAADAAPADNLDAAVLQVKGGGGGGGGGALVWLLLLPAIAGWTRVSRHCC